MQLMHLPFNYYLILLVFCATLCSYNFHYILAGCLAQQKVSLQLLVRRPIAAVLVLFGIILVLFVFNRSGVSFIDISIACVLTLLYSIPLLPFKQLDFARRAGFLKTVLLAFTWMFVTAYLPLSANQLQFSTTGILIMAKRFLFMLMLCILFDNRDINVDKVHGLHSLATDLSPKTMQWLIYTVFTLLFGFNFFLGKNGISTGQVTALQLSALITLVVYYYSKRKQSYFFYYFIVDGMMVLMTLFTTVASI
jgi:4-hydroxybenzoate polyprenyltransferase